MSDDNIVMPFPKKPEAPENLLTISDERYSYCSHDKISLEAHTREVRCANPKCGKVFDAFDYLLMNAQHLRSAWANYAQMQRIDKELNQSIANLKAEEKRLRALLKRLNAKNTDTISTRPES